MILHVFGLRWSPEASAEDRERAEAEVRAFPAAIPGIEDLHIGPNVSENGKGFETVGTMRFADQAALRAYLAHPVHQAFVAWVGPLVEAVDLDVEVG